jgi:hypothetical protein
MEALARFDAMIDAATDQLMQEIYDYLAGQEPSS